MKINVTSDIFVTIQKKKWKINMTSVGPLTLEGPSKGIILSTLCQWFWSNKKQELIKVGLLAEHQTMLLGISRLKNNGTVLSCLLAWCLSEFIQVFWWVDFIAFKACWPTDMIHGSRSWTSYQIPTYYLHWDLALPIFSLWLMPNFTSHWFMGLYILKAQ